MNICISIICRQALKKYSVQFIEQSPTIIYKKILEYAFYKSFVMNVRTRKINNLSLLLFQLFAMINISS